MSFDVGSIICTIFMSYIVNVDVLIPILGIHFEISYLVVWVIFEHLLDVLLVQNRVILIDTVDRGKVINIYEVKPCF
jgi:hypothetical protein